MSVTQYCQHQHLFQIWKYVMLQGTEKNIPYFFLVEEVMDQSCLWKFYFPNATSILFTSLLALVTCNFKETEIELESHKLVWKTSVADR